MATMKMPCALSGGGINNLSLEYTGNVTWSGGANLTIPTTKKAIGVIGAVLLNGYINGLGGIGDEYYERGNAWTVDVEYNENSIVLKRSYSSAPSIFAGYVIYAD